MVGLAVLDLQSVILKVSSNPNDSMIFFLVTFPVFCYPRDTRKD